MNNLLRANGDGVLRSSPKKGTSLNFNSARPEGIEGLGGRKVVTDESGGASDENFHEDIIGNFVALWCRVKMITLL